MTKLEKLKAEAKKHPKVKAHYDKVGKLNKMGVDGRQELKRMRVTSYGAEPASAGTSWNPDGKLFVRGKQKPQRKTS